MFEEEGARLVEFIPQINVTPTPFQDVGDFFMFIGLLVCGGFIVLWTLRKLSICLYWTWKDRRNPQ